MSVVKRPIKSYLIQIFSYCDKAFPSANLNKESTRTHVLELNPYRIYLQIHVHKYIYKLGFFERSSDNNHVNGRELTDREIEE